MNLVEILHKLSSLKTERGRSKVLKSIPKDSDFWYVASNMLDPIQVCFNRCVSVNDPQYYGEGVPNGVIEKINDAIKTSKLTPKEEALVLEKFSKTCTKEEWKEFYRPFLEGNLYIPISIKEFHKTCPLKYALTPFMNVTLTPLEKELTRPMSEICGFSGLSYVVEPYYNAPRAYWFLGTEKTVMFSDDGKRIRHPVADKIQFKSISQVMLEVYVESEEILIVRDIYESAPFISGIPPRQGLLMRLDTAQILVRAINEKGYMGIEMNEYYLAKQQNVLNTMGNLILEQGYPGFVIRAYGTSVSPDQYLVLPNKKATLTCLDITPSHIFGESTVGRKKVRTKVYFGLNSQQRDQYFKDKDSFIGKRFDILCCAKSNEGITIPVFQQWRD